MLDLSFHRNRWGSCSPRELSKCTLMVNGIPFFAFYYVTLVCELGWGAGVMAVAGILAAAADLVERKHVRPGDRVPLRALDLRHTGRPVQGREIRQDRAVPNAALTVLKRHTGL